MIRIIAIRCGWFLVSGVVAGLVLLVWFDVCGCCVVGFSFCGWMVSKVLVGMFG